MNSHMDVDHMDIKMTLEEFDALIAAYGADDDKWPVDKRPAMQALMRNGAESETAAILARAARLDATLDARLAPADETLAARVLADMETVLETTTPDAVIAFPQVTPTRSRMFWAGATALAACFLGGFIMAPIIFDTVTGSGDLFVSLDIISDTFLPTEPL